MIELRWLETPHPAGGGFTVTVLQYRQEVDEQWPDGIFTKWSEWRDVPRVASKLGDEVELP